MIYLLYGTKEFQIKEKVKELTKKTEEINISKYNIENNDIKEVIDDCETYSLFETNKTVIVENANMFTGKTSNGAEEIEKYLKNPNPQTTLIFIVNTDKIDSRKKITKQVSKIGKVLEFNEELNPETIIKKQLKDYEIDNRTINALIKRVGTNPLILSNEIEKIKIYKENDKNITEKDIIEITSKTIDIDIFKLIDNIVKENKNEAIEMYHQMLKINEEPLKIIIILANQFRIMYQSKELLKKGYSEKDIASILKIHPYRIKLALQNSRTYDSNILLKFIEELANIDINIKTGKTDKNLALELFILRN